MSMSDTARLAIFSLVAVIGALLAWQKVISGDAWLTLVMGTLLPSPLENRKPGGGPSLPAAITALIASFAVSSLPFFVACLVWFAGVAR